MSVFFKEKQNLLTSQRSDTLGHNTNEIEVKKNSNVFVFYLVLLSSITLFMDRNMYRELRPEVLDDIYKRFWNTDMPNPFMIHF